MNKLLTLTIALFTLQISAQELDELYKPDWKIDEAKEIYSNKIYRRLGDNDKYKTTNISYQTYEQVKQGMLKSADDQMWSEDKKNTLIGSIDRLAKGGKVGLYIERLTIESANAEFFTLIIHNADNKEIYRFQIKSKIADTPYDAGGLWHNYVTVPIPVELKGTNYIYIIDAISKEVPKYKFEITLK
jgi:hypothetical protein